MQNLELTLIFIRVAEMGSFTRAADSLGIRKGRASTAVRRLEEEVGVRLLHRTTRSVHLTEVGRAFHARALDVLADVDELHSMFAGERVALRGRLRVELCKRSVAYIFVREIEAEDSLLGEIKEWFTGPVIANELRSHKDGERLIEAGMADALAFGRHYIATPDLAERLQQGLPLDTPDKDTFFGDGPAGYTDYPRLV